MRFEHVLAFAQSQPWAIHPDNLRVIESLLARRIAGEKATDEEVAAAVSKKRERGRPRSGGVAVLPLHGTITQRADLMTEWSGGTSTDAFGSRLDAAVADDTVEAVVLDIHSPGGSVFGVAELGDKIHAAAKVKRVVAAVNSVAASGAYWLAAQASEVVVTPNGQVGSIGVFNLHLDVSEAMARSGQKVTVVSAGERKGSTLEYAPLSQIGREELQASADDYHDKFVRAVARDRNVSLTAVREGFGRGGMVRAEQAVRDGMADRVGTFEQVLARFGLTPADAAPAAQSPDPEVEIRRRRMRMA